MKKRMMFVFVFLFLILGCSPATDEDKLMEAQMCLDESNRNTVRQCSSLLSGQSGVKADLLRCSVEFIAQGLNDPVNVAKVFEQIDAEKNEDADGDRFFNMMTFLVFDSMDAVEDAETYCAATGIPTLTTIVRMAKSATAMANLTGSVDDFDPDDPAQVQLMEDKLLDLDPNSSEADLVVDSIKDVKDDCDSGSKNAEKSICDQLDKVIGNETSTEGILTAIQCAINPSMSYCLD